MSHNSGIDPMKHAKELVDLVRETGAVKHAPIIVGLSHDSVISAAAIIQAASKIGHEVIVVSSNQELKNARHELGLPEPKGDMFSDAVNEIDILAQKLIPSNVPSPDGVIFLPDHHINVKSGKHILEDYSARGGNRKKGKTKWPRR